MKISVVMPCYLGYYKNAAKDRPEKLVRAIKSVEAQSYLNWELLIVADGCDETVNVVNRNVTEYDKVKLFKIKKQHNWSGTPRNTGIYKSSGDVICYLDADDIFLPDHLQTIADEIGDLDWCWFNCSSWDKGLKQFNELGCNINKSGQCGTANIAHKSALGVHWSPAGGYAKDDWIMINTLKSVSSNYDMISTVGYGVCHVPNLLDI